jgi:hypothetical protein
MLSSCRLIKEGNVDLRVWPGASARPFDSNKELIIGDLHANALKLIYHLIKEGCAELSKIDYDIFNEIYHAFHPADDYLKIYTKIKNKLGISPTEAAKLAFLELEKNTDKYQAMLDTAQGIVNQLKLKPGIKLVLIGDEKGDRGSIDTLIDMIIEKIDAPDNEITILYSNHSAECIKAYKNGFKVKEIINPENMEIFEYNNSRMSFTYSRSLHNAGMLVKLGVKTRQELLEFTEKHYLPNLKIVAISADVENKSGLLLTHAPVPFSIVKDLADFFGVNYRDSSLNKLCMTVLHINKKFSRYVIKQDVLNTYDNIKDGIMMNPIERCVWSRIFDEAAITNEMAKHYWPHQFPKFTLGYGFGHDGHGQMFPNFIHYVCNLDNPLGKPSVFQTDIIPNNQGSYSVLLNNVPCSFKKYREKMLTAKFFMSTGEENVGEQTNPVKIPKHQIKK